ncbi:MAG TPA: NfeD family protein [Lachnospiraceae bacterium]|nr:NfeD family protein [Lachnospiraceae bacterium]
MTPFYWLIALAVFLVIEIITLGLTTIWFAGGSLVAFVLALLNVPVIIQVVVFLVVSIMLLVLTRPVIEKRLNESRTKTNVNSMIGKWGKVTEIIDNFNQTGTVIINGLEWTARSSRDEIIPEGSKVTVDEVKGVTVLVSTVEDRKVGAK